MPLNWTLTWVLRFAAGPFLSGLILFGVSIYMIHSAPADDPNVPFVPIFFAFGLLPWFVLLSVGVVLVAVAWRRGMLAKLGDF